jgi:NAD(P)-dependent dehydrogenase (short-subunit alcohol dehydrogenase family)
VDTDPVPAEQGHIVTYLLRNPAGLQADDKIRPYVQSGQARLIKGDCLDEADVRRTWEEAGKGGAHEGLVDYVLSTVGQSLRGQAVCATR